jgi:hypothetical protein
MPRMVLSQTIGDSSSKHDRLIKRIFSLFLKNHSSHCGKVLFIIGNIWDVILLGDLKS